MLQRCNVFVFSVWLISGISFCCQASWRFRLASKCFLFLSPSVLMAKSSDGRWSDVESMPLPWTWTPSGARQSPGTQIAMLMSRPLDLECIRVPSFSLSKWSSACQLVKQLCASPFSPYLGSTGSRCPGHGARLCYQRKPRLVPVSPRPSCQ